MMEEILRIFVVCGTNEELKEELEKLLSKYYQNSLGSP